MQQDKAACLPSLDQQYNPLTTPSYGACAAGCCSTRLVSHITVAATDGVLCAAVSQQARQKATLISMIQEKLMVKLSFPAFLSQ